MCALQGGFQRAKAQACAEQQAHPPFWVVEQRKKAQKHFALGAAEKLSWKKVSFELAFITSRQK